ncbi:MAG: SH3 domain-containing protein [Pseudomonadota bacterium]
MSRGPSNAQGQTARLIADHQRSYENPIQVKTGQPFELTDRIDIWQGYRWIWARDDSGREGWVPDALPDRSQTPATARYDYSARELDCAQGAQVTVRHISHGWAWCEMDGGDLGWLPLDKLAL